LRQQSKRIYRDYSTRGASSQLAASTFVSTPIRRTRNVAITKKRREPTKGEQESNANTPQNCKQNSNPTSKQNPQVTDFSHLVATPAASERDRWQVNLVLKALKQNLRVKTFVGTSANTLKIHIWTALIARYGCCVT